MQKDVAVLRSALEANHPGLYWYNDKTAMDLAFRELEDSLVRPITEPEFWKAVSRVVAKIHCGHTTVRISRQFQKAAKNSPLPRLPLHIKVCGDSLAVYGFDFPSDTILKRGTCILSINGRSVRQILDNIYVFIPTDGTHTSYKDQTISGNFPFWYRMAFGIDSTYSVEYLTINGGIAITTLKNYYPGKIARIPKKVKDTALLPSNISAKAHPIVRKTNRTFMVGNPKGNKFLYIDTALSLGYMRLNTFHTTGYHRFLRKSFSELRIHNCHNLAIDLRANLGGYVANSNLLLKYLMPGPFRLADTIATNHLFLKKCNYIKHGWIYGAMNMILSRRRADGRYHYVRGENRFLRCKRRNHFDGRVFLLQGGYTYSAASIVTAKLKGKKNATIVGEESGGTAYGNSAFLIPTLVLPNSKISVSIPLYRMVMDANWPKDGKGVLPDIAVAASPRSIRLGNDPKMDTVLSTIGRKLQR